MSVPNWLKRLKRRVFRVRDGEQALRRAYQELLGVDFDAGDSRTLTYKLFARMIEVNRYGNARFTRLTDKHLVREYVAQAVGEKYLVPQLWNGTDPDAIPFDALPDSYIIKTNHDSGSNIIVNTAPDRKAIVGLLARSLQNNYYWVGREFQYYHVRPRILIDELLSDGVADGPLDYRFFCFHGVPEVIQLGNHPHTIAPFYDTSWNKLDLTYLNRRPFDIPKPENLTELLHVAERLSAEFEFVRVDLFNIRGRVYFGELTFTPLAGHLHLTPESWDLRLGLKW